jgi:hypothetical protein
MMTEEAPAPRIVWAPLPGSQALAVSCPCHHILYEGTRGPGKTDAQLMAFRKNVGQGYGAYWRGIILDRQYKNLDDLVAKSKKWFYQFGDGAQFLSAGKDYKWVWPTGEELLFRALEHEDDYWNYHGQEFPFIGWNELTKFPTRKLYDAMMSCNRSSFLPKEHTPKDEKGQYKTPNGKPLPEIPLVVFSTTNPYGAGHNWVKADFIDVAEPGEVVRKVTNVFNPRTQKREDVTKTQVRIFGSYKENRFLAPEYIAELENVPDPNKRKAWLWGDWDIVAGGALDDVWDPLVHILPRFAIPESWRIDRSFDWGSTQPFSVGWWAEADGTEVELPDGRLFCPPRGSLIQISEWYGTLKIGSNEGLKMGAADVAKGIKERESKLVDVGWVPSQPSPGPADNAIRNVVEKESESIETKMAKNGVRWTDSDKKPGSRKNGLELIRDRLLSAKKHAKGEEDPGPGLYFMMNCRASISTLPVLPRDSKDMDDVDTDAEDHPYDMTRYRVLAGGRRFATNIPVKHPT